jgi:hypothetical protein
LYSRESEDRSQESEEGQSNVAQGS